MKQQYAEQQHPNDNDNNNKYKATITTTNNILVRLRILSLSRKRNKSETTASRQRRIYRVESSSEYNINNNIQCYIFWFGNNVIIWCRNGLTTYIIIEQ